jgi:hypothetical protein
MLAEITWNQNTLAVVLGCAIPIVYILASAWVKVERARTSAQLKRRMIDRGMSADEIDRVLRAGPPADDEDAHARRATAQGPDATR